MSDEERAELVARFGRELVKCEVPECDHEFFYVSARLWPYRCSDHAAELTRVVDHVPGYVW